MAPDPFRPFQSTDTPAAGYTDETDDGWEVALPSGASYTALSEDEAHFVATQTVEYQQQLAFTNVSDVTELDRLIVFEALSFRYLEWLSKGKDNLSGKIDESALRKETKELSIEIRGIKKSLGIDKVSRDKTHGRDSVAQRISSLLQRAKAFGVTREDQASEAIELAMQLISMWTFYDQATEQERVDFGMTELDIVDWIGRVFKPEFEAIDAHFRENQMRYWVRDQ